MGKMKLRTLWISVGISFLIAVGLILGVTQTKGALTTVFIVLIAIVFIYMTIAIQIASTKTFRYKAKPIKYPSKSYKFNKESVDLNLKKSGYKLRNANYGQNYLKIDKENAYKVVIVRNNENYFNQEAEEVKKPNNDLAKCKKFIGIEIFLDYNEETLKRLPDFCLQGENVYYAGLYYKEDKRELICPNYVEPIGVFEELLNNINKDLNLEEICCVE